MTNNDDFKNLRDRLHRVIPGGAHTYSRGDDQFPSITPPLFVKGKGAYAWDSRGNKYLDYGMALRAVTLGYANDEVNQAAFEQMNSGVNLTRASMIELEAAEKIVDLIPSADMVKFAKNGSNVTTAATKIARAYTSKRYICIPKQHPFFSFDDWFIGTTALKRGTLKEYCATTLRFDYNDIDSLKVLFEKYPNDIAAVMLEPATTLIPLGTECLGADDCGSNGDHFLKQVQDLCRANNSLFILDEMITGFRWHLNGAQTYFGVEPDITTFGKGMANGHSVAAITGRREVMEVGGILEAGMERTFLLSTTHGAEMTGLGAFLKTVEIYQRDKVINQLWDFGKQFKQGVAEVAESHGLDKHVLIDGPAISMNYLTYNVDGELDAGFRTLLSQEMIRRGVLMPWLAISASHGEQELKLTMEALDGALGIYKQALSEGLDKFLVGDAVKPVFRKHN